MSLEPASMLCGSPQWHVGLEGGVFLSKAKANHCAWMALSACATARCSLYHEWPGPTTCLVLPAAEGRSLSLSLSSSLFLSIRVYTPVHGVHHSHRYGLGQILIKQEKYVEALAHFELACKINPASSVLRCCCGSALHKMGRLDEAARQLKVRVRKSVCCWCWGSGGGGGGGGAGGVTQRY